MALTNAKKQRNWRERHIGKRRTVQRVTTLLLRRSWNDEHFDELGFLLREIMSYEAIRHLHRALKPPTNEEMAAIHRAEERSMQDLWLREHPGPRGP